MAPTLLAKAMFDRPPINVVTNGKLLREFTYTDDVVEGVIRVLNDLTIPEPGFSAKQPNPSISTSPYRTLNIGNSQLMPLLDFIETIGSALGIRAEKNFMPMPAVNVLATSADTAVPDAWVCNRPITHCYGSPLQPIGQDSYNVADQLIAIKNPSLKTYHSEWHFRPQETAQKASFELPI